MNATRSKVKGERRGKDNLKNYMPLDERSFVKMYTVERLIRIINDRNPEIRKSGMKLLCDKACILESLVKNKKDTKEEYAEFRKCITYVFGIIADLNDKELTETALESINSVSLLKGILNHKTIESEELPEGTKRAIRERIGKLEPEPKPEETHASLF